MTLLYKILSISVISVICASKIFAQSDSILCALPDTTYNNTIKDTIVLEYSQGYVRFETIRREGDKYFAVTSDNKDVEITSMINGKTRALVQDGDGHELVIDKDGNVMGVEEYTKCGGSKALLRENIKEKDSQVTKSGNVKFFSAGKYLFDTYDDYTNAAKGYAERFPSIGEGDYRPAYACAESNTKIEIKAEPYKTYTFKNERGVPVLCKDGILEVTARGDRDTTSIYAYDADNHIVGKVNVLSYDKVTRKICLVPVGDTKAPDAVETKQGLDEIFKNLMIDFDVTIAEPIAIQYAKNNKFTHGGSGMIGVYNTDQKAAISKLKERGIDNETVYLFLAECSINNQLDENDKIQVVNGYMPRGYQFGFIYNEFNNYRTDAHEICHGAFHLKHTFAQDDFLAAERSTDNLMDYRNDQPKTLNHWQWKDIHQPKSVRFKWLQDEEGAESISTNRLIVKFENSELPQQSGEAAFLTLAGLPIAFDDMSLMQEMYFTGKKIEEETNINGQPLSLMTADRGLLVAFKYGGVFYTPQIEEISSANGLGSKYILKGYLGSDYYESKPNTTTNNIVWWYNNGTWEEIQFQYTPSNYYNANKYNDKYRGANHFARFIERRITGVNGNGLTYTDWLKSLDETDFFDSDILLRKDEDGYWGLLRKAKDGESNIRLVYSVVNKKTTQTEHFEFDYVLEDWKQTSIASLSDIPLTPDLIAKILNHYGHSTLDVVGLIPVVGEVSDLTNATWYLCEGEYGDAAMSATSMLPLLGDYVAKSVKYSIKVVKADRVLKTIGFSAEEIQKFQNAIRNCKADFYADFADANEEIIEKIVSKPDIIDAWLKSKTWRIRPDRDIFIKYYDVYVNPKYFDQVTGFAIYPGKLGFTKLSDVKRFTRGESQTIKFDRYGKGDNGLYLGRPKDDWSKRSLPPYSENAEYHMYQTTADFPTDIEIIDDEIDAWFDQVGGGHQFLILRKEYTGKSLEEISNAVENGTKIEKFFYTIKDMIGMKWIEEIE